jgi:probable blue pigment (indigoidine) exporter
MPVPASFLGVPILVAATACWGGGTVLTKQVLGDVAPFPLLCVQLLASCAFLLAVARAGRVRIGWSPPMRRLTALGLLNPGLAYALGLLGLASIPATTSVLLWAAEPVVILVLAGLVLRERASVPLVLAVSAAVAGVVLVVHRPGAAGSGAGIALTLAAVCACAVYAVLARGLLLDDASVSVALLQQVAALGFAVVLSVSAEVTVGDLAGAWSLTPGEWLAAGASGVLYYGVAFWCYLAGLRRVPASVAGAFIPLVPVFGIAAGHLAGERLTAGQWAGAVVVVGAVAAVAVLQLTGRAGSPRRPEDAPGAAR